MLSKKVFFYVSIETDIFDYGQCNQLKKKRPQNSICITRSGKH